MHFFKIQKYISKTSYVVGIIVFTFSLCSTFFLATSSSAEECFIDIDSSKKTLERALEDCEEQIEKTGTLLRDQQAKRTNTEYDILLIEQEINKNLLRIRSTDLAIKELSGEVEDREETVEELNEKIVEHQAFLVELLQRINEAEQKGFISLVLSDSTISSFFSRTGEYESLRETVEESISRVDDLKLRLTSSVEELISKKNEQSRVRQQQQASANQVSYQKKQKENILDHQLRIEEVTKQQIDQFENRAGQIRNRLFEFSGGGAIPFEQALAIAEEVSSRTGIRPAFLLGLIKHESDLGKNVGTGSYLKDMHPTRDQPIFPYIAKLLNQDPDELRVSANPGFGWGGAMGPAQFIPSTWVCYGGLLNVKTGKCSLSGSYIRTKNILEVGSSGSDVKRLQQFLNENGFIVSSSGAGSPGRETSQYGEKVKNAVIRFQEKYASRILRPYGYTRGTGKVGPSTRAAINQLAFYSGPWEYDKDSDVIRSYTKSDSPSNPWNPRDAFFASGIYLERLGAANDECTASRRYYAGGNWRAQVALNYCRAVQSNATLFQRDIDFLNG